MSSNSMEEGIRREREKSQAALIAFLTTVLNLAHTFLKIARTEIDISPDHSKSAVAKARDALRAIRRFQMHVEDPVVSVNIRSKAEALFT